jgi:hypothetical protein
VRWGCTTLGRKRQRLRRFVTLYWIMSQTESRLSPPAPYLLAARSTWLRAVCAAKCTVRLDTVKQSRSFHCLYRYPLKSSLRPVVGVVDEEIGPQPERREPEQFRRKVHQRDPVPRVVGCGAIGVWDGRPPRLQQRLRDKNHPNHESDCRHSRSSMHGG